MEIEFTITENNLDAIIDELEKKLEQAFTVCGGTAERYAKEACPVDTGFLRNSITWAISGEAPNISSYKDDSGDQEGSYSGSEGSREERAVYLGSNIKYAADVELGSSTRKAKPYMRPAFSEHLEEYQRMIETILKED